MAAVGDIGRSVTTPIMYISNRANITNPMEVLTLEVGKTINGRTRDLGHREGRNHRGGGPKVHVREQPNRLLSISKGKNRRAKAKVTTKTARDLPDHLLRSGSLRHPCQRLWRHRIWMRPH